MTSHHAFLSVRAHAQAIAAWAYVGFTGPTMPIRVTANWVTTARSQSRHALARDPQAPEAEEIRAACRDAEVEHAIYAHTRAIARLLAEANEEEG